MAGKRVASSELNHENWANEDEPDDAGNFTKAPEDVLKNRVIKVAKRRNPIGSLAASEGEKKVPFSNFSGFASTTASAAASQFSFLSNLGSKAEDKPKANGLGDASVKTMATATTASSALFQLPTSKTVTSSPFTINQTQSSNKSKEYYAKLKGLNESVAKWIKQHVDSNPFISLTPVFRDYEKYIEEIEKLKDEAGTEKPYFTQKIGEKSVSTTTTKLEMQKASSPFGLKPSEESSTNKSTSTFTTIFTNTKSSKQLEVEEPAEQQKEPKYSFGASASDVSSPFSFGKASPQPTSTAGFSFGGDSSKPFTFTNVAKPAETEESKNEDEDEDEPPKEEFAPVMEDGHIYTIHCKVFVKKNDKFDTLGVGNLFLKPVSDSDKVQLIVRADTKLGKLLCNLILSTNIPMRRIGNKDVMLVCIPSPESKPTPVPVLFRVKSSEDADELLRTLEKHKK